MRISLLAFPLLVGTFLLTCRQDCESILGQQKRTGVSVIQLVDRVSSSCHLELRLALPDIKLVQVVHVTGPESTEEACEAAHEVDAILLDSGNSQAAVKELGGTGRVHNWSISARIREAIDKPVFLAGGLLAENVREAVEQVRPFGLDVCSGVRTDGGLDQGKLQAFFGAIAMTD